jgi:CRISPR-associated protein Csh2
MHPVDTQYVQGTVVMPSTESAKEEEGKSQGTIWTTYTLPFAVFAMPGVINHYLASKTGMTEEDQELLLRALWQGTQHRQARGRGLQQSLFLIHVEYRDSHYRIGYLEDMIRLLPDREAWTAADQRPSSLKDITLDVTGLMERLDQEKDRIARCRIWVNPSLEVKGNIDAYRQPLW